MRMADQYLTPTHANVLFVYDGVLRSSDTFILRMLVENYYDKFSPYMDLESIRTLTVDALLPLVIARTVKNPLQWLAIKEFDYEKNYTYLREKFVNMYERSPILKHYQVIESFISSYCIGSIYIWSREYDKRIHYDIASFQQNAKKEIRYVTGDMQKVINTIGDLNIIYDCDADRVYDLLKDGNNTDVFFAVAQYGYNLEKSNQRLIHNLWERDNVAGFAPNTVTTESIYMG